MGAWLSMFAPASPSPSLSKSAPASPSPCPWSDLHPELADLVLHRMPSHADRVRFASVCRPWRHAATHYSRPSLPPPLPWLNFHDGTCFQSLPDGELHSIRRFKVLSPSCRGSFGSWLLFEGKPSSRRPSRRNSLRNPLTGATIRLPSRCDAITSRSGSTDFLIRKIIVCSSELVAAMISYSTGPDVVACCRPGMSLWSMGHWNDHGYQDMTFYDGKIYTVSARGGLIVHEVTKGSYTGEPWVSQIKQVIQEPSQRWHVGILTTISYLVISCTGKLLLVEWIDRRGTEDHFGTMSRVLEADFEKSRWLEVENLGDQVLFLSSNCSRAIRASGHGDCLKANTVYIVNDKPMFSSPMEPMNPHTCGVYDLSRHRFYPVFLGEVHAHGRTRAAWLILPMIFTIFAVASN